MAIAKADATQAAYDHNTTSLDLLDRIRTHILSERDAARQGRKAHWGDVGSANDIRRTLQALSDQIFNEGEYATVACLSCPRTFAHDDPDFTAHRMTCSR